MPDDDRTRRLEPIAVVGAGLRSHGGDDAFDARFFDIAARQAPHVGTVERVLLETAWEALENANIDPTTLDHDRGAVYVGASAPDRLASFLGLRPASGSPSALTALRLAVSGLRGRDCEIALCGAVITPHDRVERCGVLVLKRLPDAWQDGDTVLAIVRGAALASGRLEPGDIQYVEAGIGAVIETGFGLTGAIGVAVLDEAPPPPATDIAEPPLAPVSAHVFTLSAKSAPALRRQRERYRRFVAANPDADLADLCYTGNVGRAHFRHRLAGGVRTRDELLALLDTGAQAHPARREVAFLFTGSGSEHAGMGRPLYDRFPEFRTRVDECEKLFFVELGRSITDVMFGRVPDATAVLAQTRFAHAALFTLEYALACLWRSWGVRPAVLIGHGVGELVAATVAGVFSPADAAAFLSARARLIESVATPGGMAAVAAPADQVAAVVGQCPGLAIAAVNSPRQCVVSGSTDALMAAFMHLTRLGVHVRPLQVATGFHSPVLAEIAEGLRAALDGVELHEPTSPVISSRTGRPAAAAEITTTDYWVRQVTGTIDFAAGMAAIGERGSHVLLEIGPSHVLASLARQCLPDQRHTMLASLAPDDTTGATVAGTLADLYTAGLPISWLDVHDGHSRRRTALPHYAFDRPLLERRPGAGEDVEFESPAGMPYLEILLALADVLCGDIHGAIENVRLHDGLSPGDEPAGVRTCATPGSDDRWQVEITDGERTLATATLIPPHASDATPADTDFLSPPITDAVTRGLAALVDDGDNHVVTGIARLRVLGRPRADTLRPVVRVTRPGAPSSSAFSVDAVLFEGDVPIMELSGVSFAKQAPGRTRRAVLVDIIQRTVADLLSIDGAGRVDPHANLRRLGVDSLVAVELRNRLESRLHLSFPILSMYEQLSVDRLAEFLERQLVGPADE